VLEKQTDFWKKHSKMASYFSVKRDDVFNDSIKPCCSASPMSDFTPDQLMAEAQNLYAYARQRVGDHQHAEDLVQECLVTAWRKRGTFEGHSTLSTWLFGIMKFKVLDHLRSANRVPTQRTARPEEDEQWGEDPFSHLFNSHGSWKIDPNYGLDLLHESPVETSRRTDVMTWVRNCMTRLPERLRLLFTLREVDDLPVAEAAAAAGVTAGSAAVLLTRARHQLRTCLQHHEVTP
jgi:RNA polymerase sigma-70 factor (ECF subfamily)